MSLSMIFNTSRTLDCPSKLELVLSLFKMARLKASAVKTDNTAKIDMAITSSTRVKPDAEEGRVLFEIIDHLPRPEGVPTLDYSPQNKWSHDNGLPFLLAQILQKQ